MNEYDEDTDLVEQDEASTGFEGLPAATQKELKKLRKEAAALRGRLEERDEQVLSARYGDRIVGMIPAGSDVVRSSSGVGRDLQGIARAAGCQRDRGRGPTGPGHARRTESWASRHGEAQVHGRGDQRDRQDRPG